MKFSIGSDHGGLNLKALAKARLEKAGHEVLDVGPNTTDSVDYPDFGKRVAQNVASGKSDMGVLICGTGLGMSMVANKVKGIRAALCTDPYMATMAKEHNNANILVMGERVIGPGLAETIVDAFLAAEFQGGRHERRVGKIDALHEEQ
jgi:ribose 5-phosphate isomerase B